MLRVPGTTPSRTASSVAIASTAPAAPSMWPVIDLVAVTTGWSPMARRMVLRSARSPTGVEVACALTWPMSVVDRPAVRSALVIARAAALAVGLRGGDVVGVVGHSDAGERAVDRGAAGDGVVAPFQHHDPGALAEHEAVAVDVEGPRGASPGRRCGCSSRASGRSPATGSGWMQASAPPASATSNSPCLDHPVRPGQALGAGGAGRHRSVHAAAAPSPTGPPRRPARSASASGSVRTATLRRPLGLQHVVLAEQGERAADAGADHHARAAPDRAPGAPASAQASRAATSATC